MVPLLSALSLALCHEALEGCGNHKMETSIAKRNFPSCSLRSQFTASQKLPLLFPNAKHMESATGTIKSQKETSPLAHFVRNSLPHKSFRFCSPMRNIWNQQLEPSNRKKKLPLLLTSFAIHCLTKASAFVPQCETDGNHTIENHAMNHFKLCDHRRFAPPPTKSHSNDGSSIPTTAIFECLACASHPNILSCRGSYCRNGIMACNHAFISPNWKHHMKTI